MEYKQNVDVVNMDGNKVGEVDRVVLDPRTMEVTHYVVRKGLIFPKDKVLPADQVSEITEDRLVLKKNIKDADDLTDYQETHYVPVEEAYRPGVGKSPSIDWYYGGPGLPWWGYPGYPVPPPYISKTETNVPEGTVVLNEGANVVARDGEKVGEVEIVYAEPKENRITHLMLAKGILAKERKLIPTSWIESVDEKEVRLIVDSGLIKRMPPQPEEEG